LCQILYANSMNNRIKLIVTLGPSTKNESDLRRLKDNGVDFVRVNMSHSSIEDLEYFVALARKVGIPFIIDTEGSQIRSDMIAHDAAYLEKGHMIKAYAVPTVGDAHSFSLRPGHILGQLAVGDILRVGFDSLALCVSDVTMLAEGYIVLRVHESGVLGSNKGIAVHSSAQKQFNLHPLTKKDHESIAIGLREQIGHLAASFIRSGEYVDAMRKASNNSMKIISKVECADALLHIDDIIKRSDMILIDRGDLSKEIPVEKIPFVQKIILKKAREAGKEVFVATNLLETMVEKRSPTLAEVHDIVTTVRDGAAGVTLSAETAIGKHPIEAVMTMNRILKHASLVLEHYPDKHKHDELARHLEQIGYLVKHHDT